MNTVLTILGVFLCWLVLIILSGWLFLRIMVAVDRAQQPPIRRRHPDRLVRTERQRPFPQRPMQDELLPVPTVQRPGSAITDLDLIDRAYSLSLEQLLALMLEGRRLERRSVRYGYSALGDEWLLIPVTTDLSDTISVSVPDAERAARHPSVFDASEQFGQPIGTSYLHCDTVAFLRIRARLRTDATEERRRRAYEQD